MYQQFEAAVFQQSQQGYTVRQAGYTARQTGYTARQTGYTGRQAGTTQIQIVQCSFCHTKSHYYLINSVKDCRIKKAKQLIPVQKPQAAASPVQPAVQQDGRRCYKCDKVGHTQWNCTTRSQK
jgi:hypothetical protein